MLLLVEIAQLLAQGPNQARSRRFFGFAEWHGANVRQHLPTAVFQHAGEGLHPVEAGVEGAAALGHFLLALLVGLHGFGTYTQWASRVRVLQRAAQRTGLPVAQVLAGFLVGEDEAVGLQEAAQVVVGTLLVGVVPAQRLLVVLQARKPLVAAGNGGLLLSAERGQLFGGGGSIGAALAGSSIGGGQAQGQSGFSLQQLTQLGSQVLPILQAAGEHGQHIVQFSQGKMPGQPLEYLA